MKENCQIFVFKEGRAAMGDGGFTDFQTCPAEANKRAIWGGGGQTSVSNGILD